MLEKAVRICDAKYGDLYLPDDGKLRLVAALRRTGILRMPQRRGFRARTGRGAR